MRNPFAPAWLVLGAVVAMSRTAGAAGFSIATFGGEHGNPTTTNPTALYYNPAGIADSEGGHVYVDGNMAWRYAQFTRTAAPTDAPVPAGAEGANTGSATLLNVVLSPFAGASYRLGRFAIGASFSTPFGGQSAWDKNERFANNAAFPGAVDGVQRWWAISGILKSSFFTLGGGYDFGPLSFGVAANLIQTTVALSQAREPSAENDIRTEGRTAIDASSWDGSVGFGVTYKAIPNKLKFGLSYQSRPGFGSGIVARGKLKTVFPNGKLDTNEILFTTDLPDVVRAGVAYRPRRDIELRLSGDFQTWSVLERQCVIRFRSDSPFTGSTCGINADGTARTGGIPNAGNDVIINQPRDFHDTFGVNGSVSYWVKEDVELLGGLRYVSNAIPAHTYEPGVLDANAVALSLGAIVSPIPRLAVGLGYMQFIYFPRDTTGQNTNATLLSPSRGPDAGGKYTILAGVTNVTVDFAF